MKLVLASGSPRRQELLANAGFDFEVVPSGVDEGAIARARPADVARALARAKAVGVAASRPDAAVLAADTIVVHRGDILGKPATDAEARATLLRLRGREHRVITAVCLVTPGSRPRVEHVVTRVFMRPYEPDEIEMWITRGEPFDRAGAYAIQDPWFAPVASYESCYCNVVGLPIKLALRLLAGAGITPVRQGWLPSACATCDQSLRDDTKSKR